MRETERRLVADSLSLSGQYVMYIMSREIPKGEEYFAFTSNKTANGMYVEGPLMMTKSEPIPLVGLIPAIIATWINRLHLFVKRHGGCLYGIVARRHTRNLPSIARRIN
jgi:hypothetical protein